MSGRVNPKIGEPPTPWSFDSAFLWNEIRDIVQETGIKTISMEKKCKKAKWLCEEALQIAMKRREAKSKGEKEK